MWPNNGFMFIVSGIHLIVIKTNTILRTGNGHYTNKPDFI